MVWRPEKRADQGRIEVTVVTVLPAHIRACGLCMGGARQWFARHGLSWSDFVTDGVAVETIEATGDALGMRVAATAREDASRGKEQ